MDRSFLINNKKNEQIKMSVIKFIMELYREDFKLALNLIKDLMEENLLEPLYMIYLKYDCDVFQNSRDVID